MKESSHFVVNGKHMPHHAIGNACKSALIEVANFGVDLDRHVAMVVGRDSEIPIAKTGIEARVAARESESRSKLATYASGVDNRFLCHESANEAWATRGSLRNSVPTACRRS